MSEAFNSEQLKRKLCRKKPNINVIIENMGHFTLRVHCTHVHLNLPSMSTPTQYGFLFKYNFTNAGITNNVLTYLVASPTLIRGTLESEFLLDNDCIARR